MTTLPPFARKTLLAVAAAALIAVALLSNRGQATDEPVDEPTTPATAAPSALPRPATTVAPADNPAEVKGTVQASQPLEDRAVRAAATRARDFLVRYAEFNPKRTAEQDLRALRDLLDKGAVLDPATLVTQGLMREELAAANVKTTARAAYKATAMATTQTVAFVFEVATSSSDGTSDVQDFTVTMTGKGSSWAVYNLAWGDEFGGH